MPKKPKKRCVICDDEMGFLKSGMPIKDGVMCLTCQGIANFEFQEWDEQDIASVKARINQVQPDYLSSKEMAAAFTPTKSIDKYFFIDEGKKQFRAGKDGDVCNYADLVSFELLEDGESVVKGGLGRAVVGAALFGGTGAIVGGVTGGKTSKGICTSMSIVITVKNTPSNTQYINFIGGMLTDIKKSSFLYKDAQKNAQECLSALKIIADEIEPPADASQAPAVDTAAEIEKFHSLMEKGIISEDEFNAKKAQLLGL